MTEIIKCDFCGFEDKFENWIRWYTDMKKDKLLCPQCYKRRFPKAYQRGKPNMEDRDETIFGHYGVKRETFERGWRQILADMLTCDSRSEVLDKHFPTLDGEGRVKVLAFAKALSKLDKVD